MTSLKLMNTTLDDYNLDKKKTSQDEPLSTPKSTDE